MNSFRRTWPTLVVALTTVLPAFAGEKPGYRSMFNGKDLTGWDAEAGLWRVKDGVIEGGKPDGGPIASSTWLIWQEAGKDASVKNFHFKTEFWMGDFNSGVQYRSRRLHPKSFGVGGYQADFLNGLGTGGMYHQSHQGPNAGVGESIMNESGKAVAEGQIADARWLFANKYYAKEQWSRCDVVCRGNHLTHFINGFPVIEYIDLDEQTPDRKRRTDEGVIALQLHASKGTQNRVLFRELHLKQFADAFGDAVRIEANADFEGWRLPADGKKTWTATQTDDPKRTYTRSPSVHGVRFIPGDSESLIPGPVSFKTVRSPHCRRAPRGEPGGRRGS